MEHAKKHFLSAPFPEDAPRKEAYCPSEWNNRFGYPSRDIPADFLFHRSACEIHHGYSIILPLYTKTSRYKSPGISRTSAGFLLRSEARLQGFQNEDSVWFRPPEKLLSPDPDYRPAPGLFRPSGSEHYTFPQSARVTRAKSAPEPDRQRIPGRILPSKLPGFAARVSSFP